MYQYEQEVFSNRFGILTTEAVVVDKPELAGAPAMPYMGSVM